MLCSCWNDCKRTKLWSMLSTELIFLIFHRSNWVRLTFQTLALPHLLCRRANARKVSFFTLSRWQIKNFICVENARFRSYYLLSTAVPFKEMGRTRVKFKYAFFFFLISSRPSELTNIDLVELVHTGSVLLKTIQRTSSKKYGSFPPLCSVSPHVTFPEGIQKSWHR